MDTMKNMLNAFEQAACKHVEATQEGNARVCNRNYDKLVKIVSSLKKNNSLDELRIFLNHEAIGVRLCAATFLLPKYEQEASDVLEAISKGEGIISFVAEMTLKEWRKGNLKNYLESI